MAAPARIPSVSDPYTPLTPGASGADAALATDGRPSPQNGRILATVAMSVAIAMVLLLPAIFNGYPILFSDTADYLLRSETLLPSPIRAPGYAFWLRFTSGGTGLWLPVVAQALMLSALAWQVVRVVGRPRPAATLGGALAMVLFTSVGWVSSKAMPDLFVAMVVLGLYLIACKWNALGAAGRALAIASVAVGATMHLTNALVGAAALAAMLALQLAERADRKALRPWTAAALLLVASAAGSRAYDYVRRDVAQPSNGGMFVLSHLVETGLAEQLLQERCEFERFALCAVRDTLTRPVEMFVWRPESSPRYLVLHNDPALIRSETLHLLRGIVRHHPFALAGSIVAYTARQFVTFRVNDEIWRHRNRTEVQRVIARMYPNELPAQERARQQANTLRLPWTPLVHLIAFLAAAAFSIVMLKREHAARRTTVGNVAGFHVMVWITLIANAAVCANLASVFSRYQSRVSWLLPFAVLLSLVERGTRRFAARDLSTAQA
jgi:hypothetical protein